MRYAVIFAAAQPCPRCGARMVVVDTSRATERGLIVHRECEGCGHEEIGAVRERRAPDDSPRANGTDAFGPRAPGDPGDSADASLRV